MQMLYLKDPRDSDILYFVHFSGHKLQNVTGSPLETFKHSSIMSVSAQDIVPVLYDKSSAEGICIKRYVNKVL